MNCMMQAEKFASEKRGKGASEAEKLSQARRGTAAASDTTG